MPRRPDGRARRNANGSRQGGRSGGRAATVVTAPVGERHHQRPPAGDRHRPRQRSVTVKPYTSGRLTEILVESGAQVEKGAGHRQARFRDRGDRARPRQDRRRTTPQAKLERVKCAARIQHRDRGAADRCRTGAGQCRTGAARRASWRSTRRSIVAPITGIVGILPVEAGNYVTSQSAIATIDDRSSIIVDFWVPERFAAAVKVGAQLSATPIANPERGLSPARSRRSTTASTRRAARCWSRRRSPIRPIRCAPACRSRSP